MYYSTAIGGDVAIVTKGGPGRSEFLHPPLDVGEWSECERVRGERSSDGEERCLWSHGGRACGVHGNSLSRKEPEIQFGSRCISSLKKTYTFSSAPRQQGSSLSSEMDRADADAPLVLPSPSPSSRAIERERERERRWSKWSPPRWSIRAELTDRLDWNWISWFVRTPGCDQRVAAGVRTRCSAAPGSASRHPVESSRSRWSFEKANETRPS
jgi:hypothetical protein